VNYRQIRLNILILQAQLFQLVKNIFPEIAITVKSSSISLNRKINKGI